MQTGGGISEYKNLKFLNYSKISDFDTLHELFFSVLAKPLSDENRQKSKFAYLPYLNSSIFQKQSIEKKLSINAIENSTCMQIYAHTSLFDENHKKRTGESKFLEYLFEFLDAFDFGESANHEQEMPKSDLISSAVLGQVFERLNGYKDGSFYTPSFITSYMCKQSIDKVVLAKFSEFFGSNLANLDDLEYEIYKNLKNAKENRAQIYKNLNAVIDSIKICDPAVGSGYFLVSALNYIIALKSNLGILIDENAKPLKAEILLEFDELRVFEFDGSVFKYSRPNSQNEPKHIIQKTLFKEKAKLIENCLFGVDINPNSCEIARLRLWIELLKSSYFTDLSEPNPLKQNALETLPNIDINIKCGNSLVSYFALKNKFSIPNISYRINQYKHAVNLYKAGLGDKMLISNEIKNLQITFKNLCFANEYKEKVKKFKSECDKYSQKYGDYLAKDDLRLARYVSNSFFVEFDENEAKKDFAKLLKLYDETFSLDNLNPFEWRFEFPEILDENGDFMGFDLIIANPPYIKESTNKSAFDGTRHLRTYQGKMDLWYHFIGKGFDILKNNGILAFIATNNWTTSYGAKKLRNVILKEAQILQMLDFGSFMVFDSASIQTMVMFFQKSNKIPSVYNIEYSKIQSKQPIRQHLEMLMKKENFDDNLYLNYEIKPKKLSDTTLTFSNSNASNILEKIENSKKIYLVGNEIQIGIGLTDKVKAKMNIENARVGDGIFQLSSKEILDLNLTNDELKLIKPLYTTQELFRFYADKQNKEWVIYTNSSFKNPNSMDNYPNLKAHLDKFQNVIGSDNKPYGLHRAKQEHFFNQTPSIVALRKCTQRPVFTYVDFDCYVTSTFYIIQTQRIDMKYLVGILNSKLIAFWLKNKGKMQGTNYQIDKEPLMNIPIAEITPKNQNLADEIINLVDKILKETDENERANLSSEIDKLVYQIYDLNADEIALIENA